jgi:hypothetical protein
VNISASGTLSAQDATTGCVLNGTVSTLDTRYNLYQIQITYSDCQGLSVDLNGQVFIGLATLDNTASPEVLFAMAKATSLTNRYLSLYYLVRSS